MHYGLSLQKGWKHGGISRAAVQGHAPSAWRRFTLSSAQATDAGWVRLHAPVLLKSAQDGQSGFRILPYRAHYPFLVNDDHEGESVSMECHE